MRDAAAGVQLVEEHSDGLPRRRLVGHTGRAIDSGNHEPKHCNATPIAVFP
jgi:hypothetical protein